MFRSKKCVNNYNMKKVFCFVFLLLFLLGYNCFSCIDNMLNGLTEIQSIRVIISENVDDYDGVFNGNKKIVEVKNFDELHNIDYDGVTITLMKKEFNLYHFIDYNHIDIVNNYIIDDKNVYDCKYGVFNTGDKISMQIVEDSLTVIIGIPMILNSF